MTPIQEGDLLWSPSESIKDNCNISQYMRWLATTRDLHFTTYQQLWQWSVTEIAPFWESIAEYFDVRFTTPPVTVLESDAMPGAKWFIGATLNYAQNIFANMTDERPAVVFKSEDTVLQALSWAELYDQTNRLATTLRGLGVKHGDRVVSFMPNVPETLVALLATASIGAIWSSCSPDFGARSVLDRFSQIEPKVLFAVDGYRYGGKAYDRRETVAALQANLPTLENTILLPRLDSDVSALRDTILWSDALSTNPPADLDYEAVPFDHPLWVLYSSGTTGLPKPIVHGHGGIVLEHVRATSFHNDLGPDDRFFWFSTTGWMMWNYVIGGLLSGCTIVLYDGSPAYPDANALWQFAEESGVTYFGTGAAYIHACMKAGIHPNQEFDLSRIRGVGSTGSPLSVDGFGWIYDNINADLALESLSGGTDLCTAFIGGARTKPIFAGELQGASLGASVQAYNENGDAVLHEVGEMVITKPMPSMPITFWNDPDMARYKASYFEMFEGVWRHGDWIKINAHGGCVIYGRSDATINRHGVRMGTAEIYRAVESLPEVTDSLVIDLEGLEGEPYMPLFVVLAAGVTLDDDLKTRIRAVVRTDASPRHVPNDIFAVDAVPYTLSGKKMEIPVRKILLGKADATSLNAGVMRNPESLDYFYAFAETRRG